MQREPGKVDGIEQFNFYSSEFADHNRVPKCILPFMDEITAFCDVSATPWPKFPIKLSYPLQYLMNSVNRRLLRLLSLVLELPVDYLWGRPENLT
jgi:hypothetical protein